MEPLIFQIAVAFPVGSTTTLADVAPALETVDIADQLPPAGTELDLTTPPSNQMAVTFPLLSIPNSTEDASTPGVEIVKGVRDHVINALACWKEKKRNNSDNIAFIGASNCFQPEAVKEMIPFALRFS
jgi:hypothetical protein